MDIDLKAAIQFAHIARTRSFSRSAAEMGVSQPWLSARIKQLEERLGCKLMLRTTRHIELTAEGKRLLPAAEALASSAASLAIAAAGLHNDSSRRIRVGSPPYAAHVHQRIALIEQFAAATRAVVELDIGWSRYLIDHLQRGDLDVAFLVEPVAVQWLETMKFCQLHPILISRPTDPLAANAILRPADIAGRVVGVFTRNLNPDLFDSLFSPLLAKGVKLVELPELNYDALISEHPNMLSLLFSLSASSTPTTETYAGLIRRPLVDVPKAQLLMARRQGPNTTMCEKFWNMAQSFRTSTN